jgi:tetratricopeptide (TPR) repeat protein
VFLPKWDAPETNSLVVADAELNLAEAYLWKGRKFDANNAALRVKQSSKALLKISSIDVADFLIHQAKILSYLGEYKDANQSCQRALQIYKSHSEGMTLKLAEANLTAARLRIANRNLDLAMAYGNEVIQYIDAEYEDDQQNRCMCDRGRLGNAN